MSDDKKKKQSPIRTDGDELKNLMNKYVAPKQRRDTSNLSESLNLFDAMKTSDITTNNIVDAKTVFQVLPELEMAAQIVITNILSPKDTQSDIINFICDSDIIGSEISSKLLDLVSEHFKKVYPLEKELPDILRDTLYVTGSTPLLVLPESSIDQLINSDNVSLEDFSKNIAPAVAAASEPMGIIGPFDYANVEKPKKVAYSSESYGFYDINKSPVIDSRKRSIVLEKCGITLEDNFNILKFPKLQDRLGSLRTTAAIYSSESVISKRRDTPNKKSKITDEINKRFRENKNFKHQLLLKVPLIQDKDMEDDDTSNPIVYRLPSESVIPVLSPGSDKPFAWLVLLDEMGYPLKNSVDTDRYKEISDRLRADKNAIPAEVRNAYSNSEFSLNNNADIKRFYAFFSKSVEHDIQNSIKNGVNKGGCDVKVTEDICKLMLARSMENQATRILYIPNELMTYITFDRNEYGVGVSLTEKNKIITGLRSILRFNNTYAAVKNSTNNTVLNIELDPNDIDAARTVEDLYLGYLGLNKRSFPLGVSSPAESIDYVQTAGVSLNVTGNPNYPSTSLNVEDKGRNMVRVDSELEESLRNDNLMGFLVTPEMVNLSMGIDYAISIATTNALFSKRMTEKRNRFCEFMSDHVRKYISNSGYLKSAIVDIIETNKKTITDYIKKLLDDKDRDCDPVTAVFELFISSLEFSLPKPDIGSTELLADAFGKEMDALDKVIDVIFSDDNYYGIAKDKLGDELTHLKAAYKCHMARKWMAENGYMTDLLDVSSEDKDMNKFLVTELAKFGINLSTLSSDLALAIRKGDKKIKGKIEDLEEFKSDNDSGDAEDSEDGGADSDSDESEDGESEEGGEPAEMPGSDSDESDGDDDGGLGDSNDDATPLEPKESDAEVDDDESDTDHPDLPDHQETESDEEHPKLPDTDKGDTDKGDDEPKSKESEPAPKPKEEKPDKAPKSDDEHPDLPDAKLGDKPKESNDESDDEHPELPDADEQDKSKDKSDDEHPKLPDVKDKEDKEDDKREKDK